MEMGNLYRDQGDHKNAKKYYESYISRILGNSTIDQFVSRINDNNIKEILNIIKVFLNCGI